VLWLLWDAAARLFSAHFSSYTTFFCVYITVDNACSRTALCHVLQDDLGSSQEEGAAAADGSQQQLDPALAAALPLGADVADVLPLTARKLGSSTSVSSSGAKAAGGRQSFRERCK
jgi:hypothetical protein